MAKKVNRAYLAPMPWRDFALGFSIATAALEAAGRDHGPTIDLGPPEGRRTRARQAAMTRDPHFRVLAAVAHHFGQDYPHLGSFAYRFWALLGLFERGHLAPWVYPRDDNPDFHRFHPALLLAASEVKLTDNAKFPVDRFRERVERIIAEEGPERESSSVPPAG